MQYYNLTKLLLIFFSRKHNISSWSPFLILRSLLSFGFLFLLLFSVLKQFSKHLLFSQLLEQLKNKRDIVVSSPLVFCLPSGLFLRFLLQFHLKIFNLMRHFIEQRLLLLLCFFAIDFINLLSDFVKVSLLKSRSSIDW